MTAARRNALRTIFQVAWFKRREDASLSMSAALKAAWAWHKEREAFYAETAKQLAAGTLRKLVFKSTTRATRARGRDYANGQVRGLYA
jgi:hypothetical protein